MIERGLNQDVTVMTPLSTFGCHGTFFSLFFFFFAVFHHRTINLDFLFKRISRNQPSNETSNGVKFFTTHFLSRLAESGIERVLSWTLGKKKINVFEKKFIFAPYNKDLHWALFVIVNPGLILKTRNNDYQECQEWPWRVSLFAHLAP